MAVQGELIADTGSWLVRNKELIAAVGTLLGVAPRALDVLVQLNRQQKENRRLALERQSLELSKLRYEIEKIRRELGQPPTPVTQPIAFSLTAPEPPQQIVEAPADKETQAPRMPDWVRWLLARPRIGRPLLWVGQAILGFLLACSALVTLVFPVTILTDTETRSELGVTMVTVELIYILMSWAFIVMYRKVRRWRLPVVAAS